MEGWLYPIWAGSPGLRAAPLQVRGFPKQCSNPGAVVGVLVVQPRGKVAAGNARGSALPNLATAGVCFSCFHSWERSPVNKG